jgi:hypothetical protein
MTVLLVILNLLAFLLPSIGFVLLFRRVHGALRGVEKRARKRGFRGPSYEDLMRDPAEDLREQSRWLKWDILWVVVGLACGAAANLIPLLVDL